MASTSPALVLDRPEPPRQALRRLWPLGSVGTVRLLSIVIVLPVWEIAGGRMSRLFMSPPSRILSGMADSFASGELQAAMLQAVATFSLGFAISIAIGVPLGIAMGRIRALDYALDSFVYALYVVPTVAFVPLLIAWVGVDFSAKIVIVVSVAVFPMIVNTAQGGRNLSQSYVEVGEAFAASRRKSFYSITIPATLPFIMAGLRLGIGRALSGMLVAEFFTSFGGLGGFLLRYSNVLRLDLAFGAVIVLMIAGIGLTEFLKYLERHVVAWKETERAGG